MENSFLQNHGSIRMSAVEVRTNAKISAIYDGEVSERSQDGRKSTERIVGSEVVKIFRFDRVAQEHRNLLLSLYPVVAVNDAIGVDYPQDMLEVNI